jgi:hypothetical protein
MDLTRRRFVKSAAALGLVAKTGGAAGRSERADFPDWREERKQTGIYDCTTKVLVSVREEHASACPDA